MGTEAHVRIDEGVKRGPRGKYKPRKKSPKADLGSWVIPKDLKPQEVLDRYLTEANTSQIAAQYGLSRKALVRWLREVAPVEWKRVQLVRAHVRLEDGEDQLETANDALSLARAREMAKAAQFRLTALDRDYHPKQDVTVTHAVPIEVAREIELLREELRLTVADKPNAAVLQPVLDIGPDGNVVQVPEK